MFFCSQQKCLLFVCKIQGSEICSALFLIFKLGVRLIPAHAGSLKFFSSTKSACVCVCVYVHVCVCVYVHVCVPAPRPLKTIHVK